MESRQSPSRDLRKLAASYGVQTFYYDVNQQRQNASAQTLLRVLHCLGSPAGPSPHAQGVAEAMRQRRQEIWRTVLEPVHVAWDGQLPHIPLRLPAELANKTLECRLTQEDGQQQRRSIDLSSTAESRQSEVEGQLFVVKSIELNWKAPWGYHQLEIEPNSAGRGESQIWRSLIISAPPICYEGQASIEGEQLPAQQIPSKKWGVFAPLYSLRSAENWGTGDFTDLERLCEWTSNLGGGFVATLPMLAGFLEEPYEPSPYSPASRLFWNEFYVDVSRAPDLAACRPARQIIEEEGFQQQIRDLKAKELTDYPGVMTLKRRVLELLAKERFAASDHRRDELEAFYQRRPQVKQYASFRAAGRRHGRDWTRWPAHLRPDEHSIAGLPGASWRPMVIGPEEYDPSAYQYHVYVQWLAHQQMDALVEKAKGTGGLYLDLPLGVNRDGFDTWRQPSVYGMTASGGAPPDAFFTKGQDWGFPPLHPQRMRENGYQHLLGFLGHHMANAGMLRIDHVMMLHRLYWIPLGMTAAEGAYVRYPAEELFAVLCLESHRNQCRLVGENLGTVPAYVNADLDRHRLRRLYVVQYEAEPNSDFESSPPGADCVASLNTHDMPPFEAYWTAADVDDLKDLGLFDEEQAQAERDRRAIVRRKIAALLTAQGLLNEKDQADAEEQNSNELHDALIAWMADGDPETVLLNLEDLWRERHRQNTPGTVLERANWCRKAIRTLEEIENDQQLATRLRRLTELRKSE